VALQREVGRGLGNPRQGPGRTSIRENTLGAVNVPHAFEAHLAGMGEDGRAVALDMLVEPDAGARLGYDRCEHGLADRKRITPQVVTVPQRRSEPA
jgi:hypothetical protein